MSARYAIVVATFYDELAERLISGAQRTFGGDAEVYEVPGAFELPPARSRTLDYLNGAGIFFAIETDDVSWYVNKSRVRLARPLD